MISPLKYFPLALHAKLHTNFPQGRYLGTGIPLPILFRAAPGTGIALLTTPPIPNPFCAPLCRLVNARLGAPILPTVGTACVSEWNDEDEVLLVGDEGRAVGSPDCLLGAGIPDVRRSDGAGIPDVRLVPEAADSGRLNGVDKSPCVSITPDSRLAAADSGRLNGVDVSI